MTKRYAGVLEASSRSGIYIAYPTQSEIRIARAGGGPLAYNSDARFYYVSSSVEASRFEKVWHVTTQTEADSSPDADEAVVYRPSIRNKCSNGKSLYAFDRNQRFVSLRRYMDHHAGTRPRIDSGLSQYFHFSMSDPVGRCVRTDDRAVYGNLETVYGFQNIRRTDSKNCEKFRIFRQRICRNIEKVFGAVI